MSVLLTVVRTQYLLFLRIVGTIFLVATVQSISSPLYAQSVTPATGAEGSWLEQQRKAVQTFHRLEQSGNYTESLAYADMNVLPIGIRQTLNNTKVTIAVSDARWETTHTSLTIFARVEIPQGSDQKDKSLFFAAQGIKLSHNGDIIGDASLVLLGDYTIPIQGNTAALVLKGSFDTKSGLGRELTFVSIDCQGFREMGIFAQVEFPESQMRPVDEKGNVIPGERVKGSFQTILKDWNDIMAAIMLPPFELNGLDGFIFHVHNAVFDFSDFRNDPAIVYPDGYAFNYMVPGNPALWRGIFINELSITLPEPFSDKSDTRPSFIANNMIIDNNGVSGLFTAAGVLPIDRGSASGWRFSVETFTLGLEANQLTEAGFSGLIGLPVSEESNLGYDAVITADNEYMLRVKPVGKTKFDVFRAEAELLPNSYVELHVVDGEFKPEALLHGNLNFAARLDGSSPSDSTDKAIAQFRGIEFRSLHLKTEAPRFTAEYFGYKGELKMMNFPVSVDRIGFRYTGAEVALAMDLKLTLSDNLFTGATTLEIVGEEKTSPNPGEAGNYKYKSLRVSNIAINAKVAEIFTVTGKLAILNDDPIYGDGYGGSIRLSFDKGLKGLDITTRAMFGRKEFRYWFVDGTVALPGQGIPVLGPVKLTGFAGGVSNRMKREGSDPTASPTSARYVPAENYGLGIKAGVMFNVGSDAAVNGEASFEIAFNRSGGVNFIGFYGFAQFVGKIPGTENMEKFVKGKFEKIDALEKKFVGNNAALATSLEKLKQYEPNKAAAAVFEPTVTPGKNGFSAAMGIQYDFTQNSLHATFDLYVNAVGGLIRGVASGNRAGWAVLHVDPAEWYIHMGTPTDRLGLKMGIGGISVETGSYLMLGSRIPGSPPPPKEVADILNLDLAQLDYMRDLNALGEGKGFAFGASVRVATGDITFLILYANFQAGVGFDIMLKDYGDAQCKGRDGKIGIDGWYANGQAYVYLQGELGVKVNLVFLKTKIPIIKGAAAALIQAKLPNPAWFRGYLGVKFSVLNGLVSGSCRFKFTIGEECELVIPGGSPLDVQMITDLSPVTRSANVDVFTAPQAAFAMRVGVPFDFENENGGGIRSYRIALNSFEVLYNGKAIPGKLVWSRERDLVSFYSNEVLPPKTSLKAIVKVGFEEYRSGVWKVVYTGGLKAEESKEVTFETGTAPDNIPLSNIEYAYPVVDQKYFLNGESKNGFIQLQRGQSYLFPPEYQYEMHFLHKDGDRLTTSFNYEPANNRIAFSLPELRANQPYSVHVVLLNGKETPGSAAAPEELINVGTDEDVITLNKRNASTLIRNDIGKSLLGYEFATSKHRTFTEKLDAIQKGGAVTGRVAFDVINLQSEISSGEPFDLNELVGTTFSGNNSLVRVRAVLDDAYYQQDMFPLLYKNYPVAGMRLERDTSVLGVPPRLAIPVSTAYLTDVENGNFGGYPAQRFPYIYNLPLIYKEDFVDQQHKIVNRFLGSPEQARYEYIINGYYKFMRPGYYKIQLQYQLPDGSKGTSSVFEYHNFMQ